MRVTPVLNLFGSVHADAPLVECAVVVAPVDECVCVVWRVNDTESEFVVAGEQPDESVVVEECGRVSDDVADVGDEVVGGKSS